MLAVVALAAPVGAYLWAAGWTALLVWCVAHAAGWLAGIPGFALTTARSRTLRFGMSRALISWARRSGARQTGWLVTALLMVPFTATVWMCFGLAVLIVIDVPAAQDYSAQGLTWAAPAASRPVWLPWIPGVAFLAAFAVMVWIRSAVKGASTAQVRYVPARMGGWRAFKQARVREPNRAPNGGRDGVLVLVLRWPAELVPATTRRALSARCRICLDAEMLVLFVWLVPALTALHVQHDIGHLLSRHVKIALAAELGALFYVNAVPWTSPAQLVMRTPRRLRLQLQILALLAAVPVRTARSGWIDPVGTHRAALCSVARDLRHEANRVQARAGSAHREGHPYAVVLRGVARAVTRFTTGRDSLHARLPGALESTLTRTVAVMAGARSERTLLRLAKAVRAFAADGCADAELAGRPQVRIVRWTQSLLAQLENARRTISALTLITLVIAGLFLLLTGHIHRDSMSTFIKY